ncbi:secreted protein [Melampsora americana]|nr:secreted protein [Melampsora americana]
MRGFQNGGGLPRNSGAGVSSNNPSGLMTCDKKVDRPANPIDCFQALQSLYQQRPQSGCVVVGSCAIMPLTREYKQKIFPGREPDLNLQVMQSAYNAMFDYYCVNYISPLSNTVSLPENTFVAGFLLGPGLGGHSQPSECSLSLRQRMIQENSIPPPTPT